ncbi:metallophosphoesterase family protein [Halobellus ordinarius]|uniref:metallophosphoesterase family protein n=1 Tax=Halobellus ordinarius TaxID=3075120 RepID=UPI002880B973|nr:metallophosphoesterase family protein [Halobellus sp. ZY16]
MSDRPTRHRPHSEAADLDVRTQIASHRRVDPDNWKNIYVIGDVHGCRATLERLLDQISFDPTDLLVFVGDLVRKGPDSAGVLDFVRIHDNAISVRGNNEQGLIDGTKSAPGLDGDDIAYLESFPVAISWDDRLVVHGGVDHRKPLGDHDIDDLLSMRSLTGGGYERPYWFERRRQTPRVFFGHTVLAEPFATPWAVGLDTGCVYGGSLTAYDCANEEFIAVAPPETHKERSDDSIVAPRPELVHER